MITNRYLVKKEMNEERERERERERDEWEYESERIEGKIKKRRVLKLSSHFSLCKN